LIDAKRVVFPKPNVVQLEKFSFDPAPSAKDVVIRTRASIISAGTELACLTGLEDWAKLPFHPGYGAVGEVMAVGNEVKGLRAGDVVFTYSNHASHARSAVIAVRVPEGLDPSHAAFARMANVAITSLRVSNAELGDRVAVIGLGLVGNLAAQLFTLAGCEVMGIDPVARRLELARACGVGAALNPQEAKLPEAVKRWTDGKGVEVVVEASGTPQGALMAAELAGKKGEVILLGSPRKPLETNVTELLRRIHIWDYGCVTFKGAHEWRYPVGEDPSGHEKHSIERNARIVLKLIAEKRLRVSPLLTHVIRPEQCAEAYAGLRDNPNEYIGVIFNWL
jgi:2-desacetyl-2-hydroxyethyl bacteriochlorophyllide A dehydrogenase